MKIGDKVRFLSDVGGGRVSGFQGKDMVLVEDEDGFDVPCLISEVVVVESSDTPSKQAPKEKKQVLPAKPQTKEKPLVGLLTPKSSESEAPRPALAAPLNLYLAFVEGDGAWETYFINDSPYQVDLVYLSPERAAWRVRARLTLEANTKARVETIERCDLPALDHVAVQVMTYAVGRSFVLKPALTALLKLDLVKFYKGFGQRLSPFFTTGAYVVDVVRDDKPTRPMFPSEETLAEAMQTHLPDKAPARVAPREREDTVVVDLHIERLLDDLTGLSPADILAHQIKVFDETMQTLNPRGHRRAIFIHGKGNGVLRQRILEELKRRYKTCRWQDASFAEYGYGATQVEIASQL